jgi:hypothetical protein
LEASRRTESGNADRRRPFSSTVSSISTDDDRDLPLMSQKISVLVVCLGNICRSPMAEAVLRDVAKVRNIECVVDSAGTASYHVGDDPDER